jgi:hypothetical protein
MAKLESMRWKEIYPMKMGALEKQLVNSRFLTGQIGGHAEWLLAHAQVLARTAVSGCGQRG